MIKRIKFEIFCIACSLLIAGSGIAVAFRPVAIYGEEENPNELNEQYYSDYLPVNDDVPDINFENEDEMSNYLDNLLDESNSTSFANSSENNREDNSGNTGSVMGNSIPAIGDSNNSYVSSKGNSSKFTMSNTASHVPNAPLSSAPVQNTGNSSLAASKTESIKIPSSSPAPSQLQSSKDASSSINVSSSNTGVDNTETLLVTVGSYTKELPADEVVSKFTEMEVGASFNVEAIKAQAVAAHTYIAYCNAIGKAPVLPDKTPSTKVKNAVAEVIDKKIYYNGNLINAVYCASTAGKTNSSQDVWGGYLPYLVSVESEFDHLDPNWDYKTKISSNDIKTIVKNNTGIDLSGNSEDWFSITSYNAAGYVGSMTIGGKSNCTISGKQVNITGRALREQILVRNGMLLKSAFFNIEISGDDFIFTTRGYGHGVGMSQHGANLYASQKGYTYEQILKHYYTGVTIK